MTPTTSSIINSFSLHSEGVAKKGSIKSTGVGSQISEKSLGNLGTPTHRPLANTLETKTSPITSDSKCPEKTALSRNT